MTERENYVIHIYRGNDLLNSLGRVNLWLPQILSAIIELYPSPLHYPFLLHVLGLVIVFLFCLSIKISWSLGRHNPKEKLPQWPGSLKHVRILCTVQEAACAGKSWHTSALYPHFTANANIWAHKTRLCLKSGIASWGFHCRAQSLDPFLPGWGSPAPEAAPAAVGSYVCTQILPTQEFQPPNRAQVQEGCTCPWGPLSEESQWLWRGLWQVATKAAITGLRDLFAHFCVNILNFSY